MMNLMQKIKLGYDIESDILPIMDRMYKNGPIDYGDMEILSHIKCYQPDNFKKYEKDILNMMGLFFKNNNSASLDTADLRGEVLGLIGDSIREKYNKSYTPAQVDMLKNSQENYAFSFSSFTSTGKSFVFRDLIIKEHDSVVIIVPSRALINEYYIMLNGVMPNNVNILTFPDVINTKRSSKTVFVLTPERAKDIFKIKPNLEKNNMKIGLVLFDEAQMADEDEKRGVFYDSIVRRIVKNFPGARLLFAHPFVKNPNAQFLRNHIENQDQFTASRSYEFKNVGQLFTCINEKTGVFYDFAVNKENLATHKEKLNFDPIEECLKANGSVLVYVAKTWIYDGRIISDLRKYFSILPAINGSKAYNIINKITDIIGGSSKEEDKYYSEILAFLHKGVVIHHGSLPLQVRFLMEEFVKCGFCRICLATSTLYQGINMPFDIVYIKRFRSNSLFIKNLIGRAGRSTTNSCYDYGRVIVKTNNMSDIRKIVASDNSINTVSRIDDDRPLKDPDLEEFRLAIKENQFNNDYNLTNTQIKRIQNGLYFDAARDILSYALNSDGVIKNEISQDDMERITTAFLYMYKIYVNRSLSDGEEATIKQAVWIFMKQIAGHSLRTVAEIRFNSLCNYSNSNCKTRFMMKAPSSLPNKELKLIPLFGEKELLQNNKYDLLIYDTYDYIDKIWGFCLSDIFYSIFAFYFEKYREDQRAKMMCNYIRYCTIDEVEIMIMRYGFDASDIEWIKPVIEHIDESEIVFKDLGDLSRERLAKLEKYT